MFTAQLTPYFSIDPPQLTGFSDTTLNPPEKISSYKDNVAGLQILHRALTNKFKAAPASAHALGDDERAALAKTLTVLRPETRIKKIAIALANPTGTKDAEPLQKVQGDSTQGHQDMGKFGVKFNLDKTLSAFNDGTAIMDLSVCGGKLASTVGLIQINNSGHSANAKEHAGRKIWGIHDALMLIDNSPVHMHGHTTERYTALGAYKFRDEAKTQVEKIKADPDKPIALLYLEDLKTKEYQIQPVFEGDTFVLNPGIVHGSVSLQGDTTMYHLMFDPPLVPKHEETNDRLSAEINEDRKNFRDEKIVYPKASDIIRQRLKERVARITD